MTIAHYALEVLPDILAVCQLDPTSAVPPWVPDAPFVSVTRSRAELSIVCAESAVPTGIRSDGGWRCLEVRGPFDFAVTGVIAALAGVLADAGVGILPIATFDTDYILTKAENLERAVRALEDAGHSVREAKPHGQADIVPANAEQEDIRSRTSTREGE